MKSTKVELANSLANAVGFNGLKDRESVIDAKNLKQAMPYTKKMVQEIVQIFNKQLIRSKKLRSGIIDSPFDCIKLLRCILRDREISMGVFTRKQGKRVQGKMASVYTYQLLGAC